MTMIVVQEDRLVFSFPPTAHPVKFDGPDHGLSHCMKAVDFVVDFSSFYLFVEVKDPDNPAADPEERSSFGSQLKAPSFLRALAQKYRDSFLYRWAEGKLDKPARYAVLLEFSKLGPADYLSLTDGLKRELPAANIPSAWKRHIVEECVVLNMATWNSLGVYGSVRRV